MNNELTVGFVGFGEAGSHIARGLRGDGLSRIFAYDINARTPKLGEKIQKRASESEIVLLDSNEELARKSDVIISTVTADAAAEAARQNAPYLEARHLYADFNSVSPALKQAMEKVITAGGGRFVEGAIMLPVPPHGHRVPILLGGDHAQALANLLGPYGMRFEVVSEQIGTASAIKMCRSIIIKGMEALLFEFVLSATRFGVDERVFASLGDAFPGIDWSKLASYMVGRVIEHGERRAREMEEVAETLRAIGVEPVMAEATARRQEWGARLNLLDQFEGRVPENYREVVRAIIKK